MKTDVAKDAKAAFVAAAEHLKASLPNPNGKEAEEKRRQFIDRLDRVMAEADAELIGTV